MTIACGQCGRRYEAALFQFGRTINCACGARVGLEQSIDLPADAELKFFADVNVASVVRWLRAASLDTLWEDAIADADLVRRAFEENRRVLTLDKRILQEFRADHVYLLTATDALAQFAEIVARFEIAKPAALFTRCLVCNTTLRAADAQEIETHAPPAVRENHDRLSFCPTCGKVYWEGSHAQRMRAAIEEVFDRETGEVRKKLSTDEHE